MTKTKKPEQKDTSPVRIFLFKSDKLKFKALCAAKDISMQSAIEDYIQDCANQGELL